MNISNFNHATVVEEEEEIKPYVHSAILTYEDKSMFMFSPNGPA